MEDVDCSRLAQVLAHFANWAELGRCGRVADGEAGAAGFPEDRGRGRPDCLHLAIEEVISPSLRQRYGILAGPNLTPNLGYIRSFTRLVEICQRGVAGGVPPHKGGPERPDRPHVIGQSPVVSSQELPGGGYDSVAARGTGDCTPILVCTQPRAIASKLG